MGILSNFNNKKPSDYSRTTDGQEGSNKGIISSIYRNIENETELVHRFPYNNISTRSVLTVQTGQMACFYINGQLADTFYEGRYVLETANIPGIQRILNLASAGDTTFQATIYFVSLLEKRNVLWGAGNMRIIDPYFNIPIKVSTRGQFGFKILEPDKFIKEFVSTIHETSTDKIYEQFQSDIISKVKVCISKFMKNNNLNINDLSSEYLEIANFTKESLQETFADFGIDLHNFNIQGIDLDESDSGYIEVMKAISDRAKSQIMGDQNYWQKKDQMEIGMMAASNEGMAGGMMGAGLGLGIGQTMGNMMGNAPQAQNTGYSQTAPPPPPQTLSFYMAQNGQTTGPFTIEQIQQGIMSNAVTKQTYFCLVGGQQWLFAEQIPQINALFATAPPPPPPAPSM